MSNKNTNGKNGGQINYRKWRGEWPQIIDGELRVEIEDVIFYPRLISVTRVATYDEGLVLVMVYFQMGKDYFKSKAYNLVTV
jgi:hypothetical protein